MTTGGKVKRIIFSGCILFICSALLHSQTSPSNDILKCDYRARIDSTWGSLPASEELYDFDTIWTVIDQKFTCFQNLDVDWNAVKDKYRPEIEKGVSRGRFAAILGQMCLALKASHTSFRDYRIWNTIDPEPGTPVLFGGTWGNETHFGAALTPLTDSSLLVYKTIPQHPLGLMPGDRVVGYDGIPWKNLYRRLLQMELPLGGGLWGSNDAAFTHAWLQSAGRNWHLFDTIDIVKYSSGDTVHLPASLLSGKKMGIACSEQLPVPGILFPDSLGSASDIGWGIVQGTNVGYVYVWSWLTPGESIKFSNAVDSLIRVYKVNGLIFDFRANNGGYVNSSINGL
jgi:hypothetical protein